MPNESMKIALLTERRKLEFREVAKPDPGPGQVRVRMKAVSICGSDVHIYNGDWTSRVPYPVRLGHEGVGYIDALGEGVTHINVGQRIVIEPNFPCGHCHYCRRGKGNICPNKQIMGIGVPGCFAEYCILPAQFAWPLPDGIKDEDAVLVEPTAVGWHALQTASLWPGDTIAVIGLGAIGLLLTHLALALGYRVIANDQVQEKMAVAEGWGAKTIQVEQGEQIGPQMKAQLAAAEAAAVFECAGTAKAAMVAIEAASPGAAVVMVGMAHDPVPFVPFDINRRGLSILTSMIYNHPADFSQTIDLIAKGTIQPAKVISRRSPFAQFPDALASAASGTETKVVLDIA